MVRGSGERIAEFYGGLTSLDGILASLRAAGVDVDRLRASDLYEQNADCQNLGGIEVLKTIAGAVAEIAAPRAGDRILDVGCGLGGPGRYLADRFGCDVLGIDLVESRVAVARNLSERCGLAERTTHEVADATKLPAPRGEFAQVWMLDASIHVREKTKLLRELARVLRPGGLLVLHDQVGPLPATMRPVMQRAPYHAQSLSQMARLLETSGFRVVRWQETTPLVLAYFEEIDRRVGARSGAHSFFALLDAYLATLRGSAGRTGFWIAISGAKPRAVRRPRRPHARLRDRRRLR